MKYTTIGESDRMILKMTVYTARCDRCKLSYPQIALSHPKIAPKSLFKTALERDGWRVTGDNVVCPDCIAKEGKE